MEKSEILFELQILEEQIRTKEYLENIIKNSEDEFVDAFATLEKPELKSINNYDIAKEKNDKCKTELEQNKKKEDIKFYGGIALGVLSGVFAILGIFVPMVIGICVAIYLVWDGYKKRTQLMQNFEKSQQECEKSKEVDEQNKIYNEKEYNEHLNAYMAENQMLRAFYNEHSATAKEELKSLKKELLEKERIVAPEYYNDVTRIILILADNRAESLEEALKVLSLDKEVYKQELEQSLKEVEEQIEIVQKTNMAKQQEEEQRIKINQAVSSAIISSLEGQKDIDYSKCHNCKYEYFCSKKKCYGYRAK